MIKAQCIILNLPWFPDELKANSRVQHRYSTGVKSRYKSDCKTLAMVKRTRFPDEGNIPLNIWFDKPTYHSRDLDNCLASIKYALDAIADAWGVNDARFYPITIDWGTITEGGNVKIEAWGCL